MRGCTVPIATHRTEIPKTNEAYMRIAFPLLAVLALAACTNGIPFIPVI